LETGVWSPGAAGDHVNNPAHDIATFLSAHQADTPIGLAVSGGSDSLGLLYAAADWARPRGARLLAFTVDHRLRAAAADEARGVAEHCAGLGVAHETLIWTAPVARQASARAARHALLAAALKAHGGQLLLTGHTREDQAETFLMRARRGSTWYGLACMRPRSLSPVWPGGAGVWIGRPLLGQARSALQADLTARGAAWVDDPSNLDPAYERVRVRALLAQAPGLTPRILACQARFADLRQLEDFALYTWLSNGVDLNPHGGLIADIDRLAPERLARGLGWLIQLVAGRATAPRWSGLTALAARVLAPQGFSGATLGGAGVRLNRAKLYVTAETGTPPDDDFQARLNARRSAVTELLSQSPVTKALP
jgi:tRNA(Ile)-lysidine synthase